MTSKKIKDRDLYMKRKMIDNGELSEEQKKKYVMYYIFYKEEPVYVGITNNFAARKGQHFNKNYRDNSPYKELYDHMSKNKTTREYSMYIVSQSNRVDNIEGLEFEHINKLKRLGFSLTNMVDGGGYVKHGNVAKINFNEFNNNYRSMVDKSKIPLDGIERAHSEDYGIDFDVLSKEFDKLDWNLLYSVTEWNEHEAEYDYEYYLKIEKPAGGDTDDNFDYFLGGSGFNRRMVVTDVHNDPHITYDWIVSYNRSIRRRDKEHNVDIFSVYLNFLQSIDDPIDLYIAIEILLLGRDEDDLYRILYNSEAPQYDMIERLSDRGILEVLLDA